MESCYPHCLVDKEPTDTEQLFSLADREGSRSQLSNTLCQLRAQFLCDSERRLQVRRPADYTRIAEGPDVDRRRDSAVRDCAD